MNSHKLAALKREARQRVVERKAPTLKQALDQVARENGYSTWEVLLRAVSVPLAPQR